MFLMGIINKNVIPILLQINIFTPHFFYIFEQHNIYFLWPLTMY